MDPPRLGAESFRQAREWRPREKLAHSLEFGKANNGNPIFVCKTREFEESSARAEGHPDTVHALESRRIGLSHSRSQRTFGRSQNPVRRGCQVVYN